MVRYKKQMLTLAFEQELQVNMNLDVANDQAPTYVWERQNRVDRLCRHDKNIYFEKSIILI